MEENRRAAELVGANGRIMGTERYFIELNDKYVVGKISSRSKDFEYVDVLNSAHYEVEKVLKEILEDCKNNAKYFSYVDKSKRGKLSSFLWGLKKYGEFIGKNFSDCDRCERYIDLRESEARNDFSIRDIDNSVHEIYSGNRSNMNTSTKAELIKKAAIDGVKWAANGNNEKMIFILKVMNGKGQDFFKCVSDKYDYTYNLRNKVSGKCGKDMFSDEYIKHYEEKIFGTVLQSKYMYTGSYDYGEFYREKLRDIVDQINSDFDRGARGTHFIRDDKYKNIATAKKHLEILKIDTKDMERNLKRFQIVDVTDKLKAIFKEAKSDGEALRNKYSNAIVLARQKYGDEIYRTNNGIEQAIKLCIEFKELVQSWSYYDIKRRYSWSYDLQYWFDGMLLESDDPGNMVYGVIAKAVGFYDVVSYGGAGVVNLLEAADYKKLFVSSVRYIKDRDEEYKKDYEELIETLRRELGWIHTLFDDPRDHKAIKLGMEYYYKI